MPSPSSPNPGALKLLAQVYTTVIRGVPDLVLMLLVFFGGQVFDQSDRPLFGYDEYIDINPFIAGVSTIGFIFGAYMTETFRGAILAVNKGQIEAANAYGMSQLRSSGESSCRRWSATPCPVSATTGWC